MNELNDALRLPVLLVSALLDRDLDTLCLGHLLASGGLVTIAIGWGRGRGWETDGGARGPPPGLTLLGGHNTTLITRNCPARCPRDLKLIKLIRIHFQAVRSINPSSATGVRSKALIKILHQINVLMR